MISTTLISVLCIAVVVITYAAIILCNKIKMWAKIRVKERNNKRISAYRYYVNKVQ